MEERKIQLEKIVEGDEDSRERERKTYKMKKSVRQRKGRRNRKRKKEGRGNQKRKLTRTMDSEKSDVENWLCDCIFYSHRSIGNQESKNRIKVLM